MDHRLANGKVIILDKDAVFRDPRAEGLAFLQALNGNGDSNEEETVKDLADYSPDELYIELEKCSVEKARLGRRRDQYTDHTREYLKVRQKQIAAELRRRGLRVAKPGSRRTLPTAAHLAVQGRELKEVMA